MAEQYSPLRRLKNLYHLIKAFFWASWYGFPGRKLTVIGVTGTDGKTSTAQMIYHILRHNGVKTALISTIEAVFEGETLATGLHVTSQDPGELQPLLKRALDEGYQAVVLEVTSHALDQHRVLGVDFAIAVVTNVGEDHLDYHGTLENYLMTKARLFDSLSKGIQKGRRTTAVINAADRSATVLMTKPCAEQLCYNAMDIPHDPSQPRTPISVTDRQMGADGSQLTLQYRGKTYRLKLPLIGRYNIDNAQAAFGAGVGFGLAPAQVIAGLESLPQIRGRMERVDAGQDFTAIVDFAHTPAALEEALISLRSLTKGKLFVLFGCAGQRDKGRRKMGEVAARLADVVVVTNEDNRDESVNLIMGEIANFARQAEAVEVALDIQKFPQGKTAFCCIGDRREAIAWAVQRAQPGDLVDFTGKGHEQSLNIDGDEHPWDEVDEIKKALSELGYR